MPRSPETAETLLARVNADYADAARRRRAAAAEQQMVLDRAEAEGRTLLTPAEVAICDRARPNRRRAADDLHRLNGERAQLLAFIDEENEVDQRYRQTVPGGSPVAETRVPRTASLSIGRNDRTYRPDNDPHGRNFLLDVARNFLNNDPSASQRLARHMDEEHVERAGWYQQQRAAGDATTGAWTGLVVPQYLVDLYAPQISALRPFADMCCVPVDLPPAGMTLNFSKITTGSSVALQATELTGVSGTSMDDTLGQAAVQTAAGFQNVSRQAIERGTGIENATVQDLFRKHAVTIDSTVLTQAATGVTNVAQTVTYTSAAPTAAEFYPFLYQAASKLEAALLGVSYPSHAIMHSRRWNWFAAGLTNTLPIVNSAGVPPQASAFSLTTEYGPQVRARLASGLLVVVDNNVLINGSSQDEVYVAAATESIYLAEDPNAPLLIRAEQPNAASLGILLVVYSYFAYFNRYANPVSKIVGTGTAAPAGF